MLSAPFNQNSNQDICLNLSDQMNDLTSNFGYHDGYNSKSELFNPYFNSNQFVGNINQDSKMYSISEVDSLIHSSVNNQMDHNHDFDLGLLSSKLQSMGIKSNCNLSRSNSAHNSPFDNRITPRIFSQSTSNTPIPIINRMNRDLDAMRGNPPIMQLFPGNNVTTNSSPQMSNYSMNRQSPIELIEYQSIASKMGFLVGQDLEEVLSRSATMKNSNSSRISNFFKHKHGSSGAHNAVKQYLVLGVRVPSKEHVSEIVGKEGKKIKMIRQTTGALIATPNEKEDHVFLIEAVPETALKVGQIIQQLADQISRNKLGTLVGVTGDRPRSPPVLGNRVPLATATIGVPQRLVGKVIGTQGSIITTVQKETGTEIKSPPKDELRAPEDNADFEISVYENGTVNSEETAWLQIHRAKQLIAHLVMRVWDSQPRNSTPSSDEGGHGCPVQYVSTPEWIWPEVARMDDGDAKEIVDRILRSSKAKITPSTSSTEGVPTLDNGSTMPTISGISPPYQHQLMHANPYKMFSSRSNDDDNINNNSWLHSRLEQQNYQYPESRSTFYNDSAFYDSYYYENGYQPDHNGYHANNDVSVHNSNDTSSWVKPTMYTNGGGSYGSEDTRFGNLKYIWKSDVNELSEVRQQNANCHSNNNHNNTNGNNHYYQQHQTNNNGQSLPLQRPMMVPSLESMFGTIGDGRKRYSVTSNNSDDREDL